MTTAHKSAKGAGQGKAAKPTPAQRKDDSSRARVVPRGLVVPPGIDWLDARLVRLHGEPQPDNFGFGNAIGAVTLPRTQSGIGMVVQPAVVISTHTFADAKKPAEAPHDEAAQGAGQRAVNHIDALGRMFNVQVQVPIPQQVQRLGLRVEQAVQEWARLLPLFIANSVAAQEGALQRAALAYQPQTQLRPVDLEILEMQKNAAEAILGGTRWLTAAEVAQEANRSKSNPHALANRWKKEGRVFAIKYQGIERYPRYAFDDHMAPLPLIGEVLPYFAGEAGGAEVDPWDIAAWFESSNTYLDSARPRERLDNPGMIRFAIENLNNMMHG